MQQALSIISQNQRTLERFEKPFDRRLNKENRWVELAHTIPWYKIVSHHDRLFSSKEGRVPINGKVIIGALLIKHIELLTDRTTIQHITKNVYMQYFLVTADLAMKHLLLLLCLYANA